MNNVIFADVLATNSVSALKKVIDNYCARIKADTGEEPYFEDFVLYNSIGDVNYDKQYEEFKPENIKEAYMEMFKMFPLFNKGTFHIIDCGEEQTQYIEFIERPRFARKENAFVDYETRFYALERNFSGDTKELLRNNHYYSRSETACMEYIKRRMIDIEDLEMEVVKITVPVLVYDKTDIEDYKYKEFEAIISEEKTDNVRKLHRFVLCFENPHFTSNILLTDNEEVNECYNTLEPLFSEQVFMTKQSANPIEMVELLISLSEENISNAQNVLDKYNELNTCEDENQEDEEYEGYDSNKEWDCDEEDYEEEDCCAEDEYGAEEELEDESCDNENCDCCDNDCEEEKDIEDEILHEDKPTLYLGTMEGELNRVILSKSNYLGYINKATWQRTCYPMFVKNTSVLVIEAENDDNEVFYALLYLNKDKKLSYFYIDNDVSQLTLLDEFENIVDVSY